LECSVQETSEDVLLVLVVATTKENSGQGIVRAADFC
jgi:hypothetical protein